MSCLSPQVRPTLPFPGKLPFSCDLWREVPGGQQPGQCWDLSNHRAKWGMWEGVLFGLARSPEQSVAILNVSHSLSFASLISLK